MTEKDLDIAIEKCERIMEMDTRTLKNPESENGWIFEKVYELLKYLRQFQFANDTNVPTTDVISRQAAIETVKKHYRVDNDLLEVIAYEIEALPSAQLAQDLPNGCTDTISRVAALSALNGLTEIYLNNLPPTIYKADAVETVKALPSAQTEIAENLYLYKCFVTDKDGLQHEVIHTGDIRRVTGWEM